MYARYYLYSMRFCTMKMLCNLWNINMSLNSSKTKNEIITSRQCAVLSSYEIGLVANHSVACNLLIL